MVERFDVLPLVRLCHGLDGLGLRLPGPTSLHPGSSGCTQIAPSQNDGNVDCYPVCCVFDFGLHDRLGDWRSDFRSDRRSDRTRSDLGNHRADVLALYGIECVFDWLGRLFYLPLHYRYGGRGSVWISSRLGR